MIRLAPDLLIEVEEIVDDPVAWLDMKNDQLGGKSPNELIAAGKTQQVRDLIQAIKHGFTT